MSGVDGATDCQTALTRQWRAGVERCRGKTQIAGEVVAAARPCRPAGRSFGLIIAAAARVQVIRQ